MGFQPGMETLFEKGVSIKVWKMDVYESYLQLTSHMPAA